MTIITITDTLTHDEAENIKTRQKWWWCLHVNTHNFVDIGKHIGSETLKVDLSLEPFQEFAFGCGRKKRRHRIYYRIYVRPDMSIELKEGNPQFISYESQN